MAVVILVAALVALVLIGLTAIFGWERYRTPPVSGANPGGARPTSEVFIDPETGRRMRVWFDDRTGEREYHPE